MKKFLKVSVVFAGIFFAYLYVHNTKLSERELAEQQVDWQTIKEINKKYEAICVSTGGGGVCGARFLSLAFNLPKDLDDIDINTARTMIVDAAQIFLNNINTSTKLKKHMIKYPFETEDIHVAFYTKTFDVGKLSIISSYLGNVYYEVNDSSPAHSSVIFEETFEEALKIVETQKESTQH